MMKFLIFVFVLFASGAAAQDFTPEEIRKHKIKKIFTNGPHSAYYGIEEYDTSGNLITISHVYDSKPPFVEEELKYNLSLLTDKRIYQSYEKDYLKIIQYFYNEKGLLAREEDTTICPHCHLPKTIRTYAYGKNDKPLLEKYWSQHYQTLNKHFYNKEGLLIKTEAWADNKKDFVQFFFYDSRQNLIRDSTATGSVNRYRYDTSRRLTEFKNRIDKILYYQALFFYNEEGLLSRIVKKERGCETGHYETSETYFNFEKYN